MANSNLAVTVNNIIFAATAPILPSEELIDKLQLKNSDVVIVIDSINQIIPILNQDGRVLIEYIGELDFFNEVIGLATECAKECRYTYDCRGNHHASEYPRYTNIMLTDLDNNFTIVDVVIDANNACVYRIHRR